MGGITEENENQLNNSSLYNNQSSLAGSTTVNLANNNSKRASLNETDEKITTTTTGASSNNNEFDANNSTGKVCLTKSNTINNENTDLDAYKMASSSDETDKLENVNSDEINGHDIDESTNYLNNKPINNNHLDNDITSVDEHINQNGVNGHDEDDQLESASAKFSLDSNFLKDETSENSFDFKVNGNNVIFLII